ncbi:MAG: glycoside hydrolase family 3 protein [Eubacteriaceae bacterium]
MSKQNYYKINWIVLFMYILALLVLVALIAGVIYFIVNANRLEENISLNEAKIEEKNKGFSEDVVSVDEILNKMTIEEKIAQLFIITPEALTGYEEVIAAEGVTREAFNQFPVGGVVLFSKNLLSTEQVKIMNENFQSISQERIGIPMFISVDEEGGEVTRIAQNEKFEIEEVVSMKEIGNTGNVEEALRVGEKIGEYLEKLNFNLNFAPDLDVATEDGISYIDGRSFGTDPELVGKMGSAVIKGLQSQNIKTAVKHFPGLGKTYGDTHEGTDVNLSTIEELRERDFRPFIESIKVETDFIMVCGISVPEVIGDNTPSCMSEKMVTDILKEELGFKGLVITDAMNMGAITNKYSSSEAAVNSIKAGVDVILMPEDFHESYEGLLEVVKSGEISEARINESVKKIIELKSSVHN